MGELRKDYILDRWVIMASERAKRPHQFKQHNEERDFTDKCFFCPGREDQTTPTRYTVDNDDGSWRIRVMENKFPAVKPEGKHAIETHNSFYTFSDAFGEHEIIVETDHHEKQLWDVEVEHFKEVLQTYNKRIRALQHKEGIKYVQVFKNHGKDAGTSVKHSHSQVIAYNKVPEVVQQECNAVKAYSSSHEGNCPYCKIIENEKSGERKCFENENFIAFTPYASRFPFEIWIFPKQHRIYFPEDNLLDDLAGIMHQTLKKLKEINASFNYVLHYSPSDEDNLHFHIEVLPRIAKWAGFEFNGTVINIMPPENSAKFYRGEK
jgi:UDPglucose--hexose-1-phosphate uridylyltransferase